MLSRNSKQRFACAVLCLFAAGCYGPGLHSPYGGRYPQNGYFSGTPYGQPQYLNQPGFNQQQIPGSYTVPGGVVLPPNGPSYAPGGTDFPSGSGSSTITPSGDWQPFNELPGDGFGSDGFGSGTTDAGYGSDNGSDGLVPRPPNGGDLMFGSEGDVTEPFGRVDSRQLEATASSFRQPRRVVSRDSQTYDYDEVDYTWLRGIISPDIDVNGSLNIAYDLAGTDEYGGNFVLVPDQRLNQFRPGEIVEVRGRRDMTNTTPLGKPMYRISSVRKLSQ